MIPLDTLIVRTVTEPGPPWKEYLPSAIALVVVTIGSITNALTTRANNRSQDARTTKQLNVQFRATVSANARLKWIDSLRTHAAELSAFVRVINADIEEKRQLTDKQQRDRVFRWQVLANEVRFALDVSDPDQDAIEHALTALAHDVSTRITNPHLGGVQEELAVAFRQACRTVINNHSRKIESSE